MCVSARSDGIRHCGLYKNNHRAYRTRGRVVSVHCRVGARTNTPGPSRCAESLNILYQLAAPKEMSQVPLFLSWLLQYVFFSSAIFFPLFHLINDESQEKRERDIVYHCRCGEASESRADCARTTSVSQLSPVRMTCQSAWPWTQLPGENRNHSTVTAGGGCYRDFCVSQRARHFCVHTEINNWKTFFSPKSSAESKTWLIKWYIG